MGEDEVSDYSGNEFVKQVEDYAAKEGSGVVSYLLALSRKLLNYPTKKQQLS